MPFADGEFLRSYAQVGPIVRLHTDGIPYRSVSAVMLAHIVRVHRSVVVRTEYTLLTRRITPANVYRSGGLVSTRTGFGRDIIVDNPPGWDALTR
jgi:hypothetical protein